MVAGLAIEIARWFIRKKYGRFGREGPGDRHALFLSARELGRVMAPAICKPDLIENLKSCLSRRFLAGKLQRQHDVFERIQRRHQMKGLKHEPDAGRPDIGPAILIEIGEIDAIQPDMAICRQIQPREQGQKR